MSLGLPAHLSVPAASHALARAVQVAGIVHLSAAFGIVLAVQGARPDLVLWPSLIGFVPMLAFLIRALRRRSLFTTVAYLAVGTASTYLYSITLLSQHGQAPGILDLLIDFPVIALVLGGGGVAARALPLLAWSAAGLVLGETVSAIAALQLGLTPPIGATSAGYFAIVAFVAISIVLYGGRARAASPRLHRAERDERLQTVRYDMEIKAAALLHDTVLNHLGAVAASRPGPLPPELRDQIERDLQTLVGEEWLVPVDPADERAANARWRDSGLLAVIEESRIEGLAVELSGDPEMLARLDAGRARVLGLAVRQCLVNVRKHAAVDRAEVVVYGSDDEVTVMVIDAGRGFEVEGTGADRMGLRHSVRGRVEGEGGSVAVWSTPGRGTSVMISLPARTGPRPTRSA